MKFLTPLFSIILFLCCSLTMYGQFSNQVIIELDQVFYDTNYQQYALPISYESANGAYSVDLSLDFDSSKIQINEVIVSLVGSAYGFSVNYDFSNFNRLQTAAYTPIPVQASEAIMYILFDKLTNDDLTASDINNTKSYINEEPANTQIISLDCTITQDFAANFEVHLFSVSCNGEDNNPILSFEIVGNNSNMPYTIEAFSQNSIVEAIFSPTIVGNGFFDVIFNGMLSPNGDNFTFLLQEATGASNIIEKTVYPCAAPDPCIASGGELTGEGKIVTAGGGCPDFYSPAVQNEGLINCGGGAEKMYLLLNSLNEIEAASLTTKFENICGLKTEQYKAVHYIQCATNRPTPDIYGIFAMNQTNHPCPIAGINPYTDLVGGCKALSTTVRHKTMRFSQEPPSAANNGYITCIPPNQNVSNDFFEGLSFAWSHDSSLNSCEAYNLGFGEYDLTVTWNDAGLGFAIDTVFHFILQQPVVFPINVALGGAYDETVGNMASNYQQYQLLPYEQVFAQNPWYYDGVETIFSADNTIIDWVLVEVRDAEDVFTIIEQKAALLLEDGRVVGADDFDDALKFYQLSPNKAYHVSIKTRHHIGVMTAQPYFLANNPTIDFRDATIVLDGFNQLKMLPDGSFGLGGGDFNGDGFIKVADLNVYLQNEGGIFIYMPGDVNCDGEVNEFDLNYYLNNSGHIGVEAIRY